MLKIPHCLDNRLTDSSRMSALCAGRALLQKRFLVLNSVRGSADPRLEGIISNLCLDVPIRIFVIFIPISFIFPLNTNLSTVKRESSRVDALLFSALGLAVTVAAKLNFAAECGKLI
jgi:hypothetical protein